MSLERIERLPFPVPDWFAPALRELLVAHLHPQLPGTTEENMGELTDATARRLLGFASILAATDNDDSYALAYEIASRVSETFSDGGNAVLAAVDHLMARIGNFPGRQLLRIRQPSIAEYEAVTPLHLRLERAAREHENTVAQETNRRALLTDFQCDLWHALGTAASVSVSAPTSAGKSFVLGLDLVRRLVDLPSSVVVYLVPTRALIREVSLTLREALRRSGLDDVPIRSAPLPFADAEQPTGAVFVLTQERLMSLLHNRESRQQINMLVVDEAQVIADKSRGVILQSAVAGVLRANPHAEIHFASPLSSNPEYLLDLFGRQGGGIRLATTRSPVSQNLFAVEPVHGKPNQVQVSLITGAESLPLGVRTLDFRLRPPKEAERAAFARAITKDGECTLLFADTAHKAEKLAEALISDHEAPAQVPPEVTELIEYVRTEIHSDYPLINVLSHGVAFHYGAVPSLVRARVEDLCREGFIQYVCCTTTLLQGINLPCKHLVLENPRRGNSGALGRADFLNLAGRAGRLLREFQGSVWCLRPSSWSDESFRGDSQQPITSALDAAMADGGSVVQKLLDGSLGNAEQDLGEVILGTLYCDYIRAEAPLSESRWATDENMEAIEQTEQAMQELAIDLPTEILEANRGVRPDRLQALYTRLREEPTPDDLKPIRPGKEGSYDRLRTIIRIVFETLGGVNNQSYVFYSWLASQWIHGTPLKEIVARHLDHLRQQEDRRGVSTVVRELLQTLEDALRFRLVKYLIAFNDILRLVLMERDSLESAEDLEPMHVYMECGASDRNALSLIALGLSRSTAIAVRDARLLKFSEDSTPEDTLAQLTVANLDVARLPSLCKREVRELLGASRVS